MEPSSEFYLIYPRPISQKERIYNWLNKWLYRLDCYTYFMVDKNIYYNCSIFQLAFYKHGVYHDMTHNKYLWYTMENYYINTDKFTSTKLFDTYDEAVREGVEEFYIKWKNNL